MKHLPDDHQIEGLLKGRIRQPSPDFERRLRAISRETSGSPAISWGQWLRPMVVAASLVIGISLLTMQLASDQQAVTNEELALEEQWLPLLSLAEDLAPAEALTDPDTRLFLEFFAFNQ